MSDHNNKTDTANISNNNDNNNNNNSHDDTNHNGRKWTSVKDVGVATDTNIRYRRTMEVCIVLFDALIRNLIEY